MKKERMHSESLMNQTQDNIMVNRDKFKIQMDKQNKDNQRSRKILISKENKKFEQLLMQKQKDNLSADKKDVENLIKIDNEQGLTFK